MTETLQQSGRKARRCDDLNTSGPINLSSKQSVKSVFTLTSEAQWTALAQRYADYSASHRREGQTASAAGTRHEADVVTVT